MLTLPVRAALAAALACAALHATPARACSVCAAGDPLVAAADSASAAHELRVGLESEWLTGEADMEEGGMVMRERLEQGTLRALVVYSPAADVNLVVQAPFVWKTSRATMVGMDHGTTEQVGFGDLELGARWFLVDRADFEAMRHHSFAVSLGSALPTGDNHARDADGDLVDEHAQLGTGGFGPYAGLLYRLEQSVWHGFVAVNGRVRTENGRGYRYGGSVGWSAQAQRQLGARVALGLGVDGRWADVDTARGEVVAHTGGLVVAAVPQVHLDVGGGAWLTLRAQVPFATALRGVQEVGPTFAAGLQYRLR